MKDSYDYDFIVIGSGFGGSVSAHRLTEKGYRVGVLEQGKRYRPKEFPKTNWKIHKYLWAPIFGCHGIFKMTLFKHSFILSGTGVGGGSLGYANTLYVPPEKVWDDPKWEKLKDWKTVMPTHFETAKKMLGVATNPYLGTADRMLKQAAKKAGVDHTFHPTDVGVFFGEPGKEGQQVPDPYFNGEGPPRKGCTKKGRCMVGCVDGGKNTLDKNYLYFAEKHGAAIHPETKVIKIVPIDHATDGSNGYEIHTIGKTSSAFKTKRVFRTRGVVFSAGVLGTMKLLMDNKDKGNLPRLSKELGNFVRTNSEALFSLRIKDKDTSVCDGVCIGSSIHIDEHTHIEPVRYGKGSNVMGGITTVLPSQESGSRIVDWIKEIAMRPLDLLKNNYLKNWADKTIVLLVMQTLDSRLKIKYKPLPFFPYKKILTTHGNKIPTTIPKATRFAEMMGRMFNASTFTSITEVLLNIPSTAHILGGAAMGDSPETGVIDSENRVWNYKNMYVCDGSTVGANLGVNPSLTITALSEQAMSHVKTKKEAGWE